MKRLMLITTAVAAAMGCLTSCGGDSPGSTAVKCDDVWVAGSTLPKNYEGCTMSNGDVEEAVTISCQGTKLVTYKQMYGFLGDTIHATGSLSKNPGYKAAKESC